MEIILKNINEVNDKIIQFSKRSHAEDQVIQRNNISICCFVWMLNVVSYMKEGGGVYKSQKFRV
jgi:phosphoserine aminotransferase